LVITATIPSSVLGDARRLATLRRTALLDTPPQEAFDRLTQLAARILKAPVALVSLVDRDRQFFKSQVGLPEPWASWCETPLSHSFCQYAVDSREPLLVEDARRHPLVKDNLAIPDLGVVAYAGIPLITADGQALGTFCVIDHTPRTWTDEEIGILKDLAASVVTEIELHLAVHDAESLAAEREAVLSQTAEGVIVTDASGRITFVNEAARRMHGVAALDVPVEDYSSTYHLFTMDEHPYPPEELPLARAVRRGETSVDARWRVRRPDGSEIIAQGSATPVMGKDGSQIGAVLVLRDVTAQHRLEEQQDAFLAAAAHDLRTPLTAIKGTAQLLRRQVSRIRGAEHVLPRLEQIDSTATRMSALLDEMLDLARLKMDRPLPLQRRPTDLVALTKYAIETHQLATDRLHLRLVTDLPELVGEWDADRLARVLDNLLNNAIKYSPNGGEIAVTVARERRTSAGRDRFDPSPGDREAANAPAEETWAVVTVTDQGVGIPRADLDRIFERFQRASNVQGRIGGTGIGLASICQIVVQHGGSIDVESEEGTGSTFTVRLPVA
jgi:PAS domain S-box-containing protein